MLPSKLPPEIAARLRRTDTGLVPAVVQESGTGTVLMLAWMDDEALYRTITTGLATYWSRSRQQYWVKGETSGHYQHVRSIAVDCDGDTLLIAVDQVGPACHTGTHSCFTDRVLPLTPPTPAGAAGPRSEIGDSPDAAADPRGEAGDQR